MITYRYKGQSADGAKVSGVIRAYDEYEAVSQLRDTCAFITKLEEVKEHKSFLSQPIQTRIREKELALICSQFSIILATGLPVMRCVEMVAAQSRSKHMRRMLEKVAEEIGAGYSMAQSFENNMPGLPKTFIETVRAGEQSGTLEECFRRLHNYYDKSAKTKAKVISTLTYPALVIVVAIIVFIIIMVVAVPAFTTAFRDLDGGQLPRVTRALMATSDFMRSWWWAIIGVIALLIIAYLLFKRTETGKTAIAAFALKRAPLRRLHSMSASGQFAASMSTMLAAGLPVPRALDVVSQVISNYVFALGVRKTRQGVERGRTISECMAEIEYFPKLLTEMVGVGERSGSLEQTLDVIGAYYDNETELLTNRLLSLLEPVITIVLAVVVVVLLLAVYLPMFSMYGMM